MSFLHRLAAHNTPAAQQYMLQLIHENNRLRGMLQGNENVAPPVETPILPAFDFDQFGSEVSIKEKIPLEK